MECAPNSESKVDMVGDFAMLYGNAFVLRDICSATSWLQTTPSGGCTGRRSRMNSGGWPRCSLISLRTMSASLVGLRMRAVLLTNVSVAFSPVDELVQAFDMAPCQRWSELWPGGELLLAMVVDFPVEED